MDTLLSRESKASKVWPWPRDMLKKKTRRAKLVARLVASSKVLPHLLNPWLGSRCASLACKIISGIVQRYTCIPCKFVVCLLL